MLVAVLAVPTVLGVVLAVPTVLAVDVHGLSAPVKHKPARCWELAVVDWARETVGGTHRVSWCYWREVHVVAI